MTARRSCAIPGAKRRTTPQKRLGPCGRARHIARDAEKLAVRIETAAVELDGAKEHEAGRLMREAVAWFRTDVVTPINAAVGALPEEKIERKHYQRLSPEAVVQMRAMYATGKYSTTGLAELFGVSQASVSQVIRGDSWAELPGPTIRQSGVKLDVVRVARMRETYAAGHHSLKAIAAMNGVSKSTVELAVNGITWPRAGGPIRRK